MPLAASSSGSSLLPLLFILLLFGALWFFMIRPQQRRSREIQSMQSALGPGDEIMTGSGLYGIVTEIDDEDGTIGLEIAPEIVIKVARGAVAKVVTSVARAEDEPDDSDDADVEPDQPVTADEPDYDTDAAANQVIKRRKD